MTERAPKLLLVDHKNGHAEVPGFFCIRKNGKPYLMKPVDPKAPMPMRWDSFEDAKAFVHAKAKIPVIVTAVTFSPLQQPIVWIAAPAGPKGDSFDINYVGSFRYHDGRVVDTLVVGSANENNTGAVH